MIEQGNSGYNQEVQLRQEAERVKESKDWKPTRLMGRRYGSLLVLVLASSLAWAGEVKSVDDGEPPVHSLADVNLINNSSFEELAVPPTIPSSPRYWNAVVNDSGFSPVYHDHDGISFDGSSSVEAHYYATSTTCGTNSWKYNLTFPVNPDSTYTESFASAYTLGDPGSTVKPDVKITWKNSQGVETGSDNYVPDYVLGEASWQSDFSRTFGPSATVIPANTVSGTIELGVAGAGGSCTDSKVNGTVYFDAVKVMGPLPPSVGGIAEEPQLPVNTAERSSKSPIGNNMETAVAGGVAALTVLAGAELLRRHKRRG